jgi:uncharacterized membrane protein YeaQ/YmgE (transglycosylase-associated protein family)
MGIISWIILGALAGWLASIILKTNDQQGALGNIIAGILGAFLGGFLARMLGIGDVTGLNIGSILIALVGAILVLMIKGAVTGKRAV